MGTYCAVEDVVGMTTTHSYVGIDWNGKTIDFTVE